MSPAIPDPYVILGVAKDAQIGEIRSAHRKLVLKCHPDKVQDPELKAQKQDEFQKVQQAYEILSDEKERKRYDDTVQLAELRRQMQNKANISVSRSSPKYTEFEIRTAEPSSYKSTSPHMPPNVKVYTPSYSRSWEDDRRSSPRYQDGAEPARSSRREATYSDRPSKRESEKEREREKEREKEKERERRKRREREREEELRRQEKEDKKAREKDKKARDKLRTKDIKRETENKRRDPESPYIETWEEDPYGPKPEKKKSSSSRKHEEKRERSSQRDEPPSVPRYGSEEPTKIDHARAYIQQSQRGGPERTHAYHLRSMPAVPTPPPNDTASFPPPEEEIRRSSARPRPGSGEAPALSREKSSYSRPSRERLDRDRDEPIIVSASPTARHPFPPKMAAHPEMSSSPPHISQAHRTNTMPSSASAARPIPPISRSNTFSGGIEIGDSSANKGRNRTRKYSQVPEEAEFEEDYDRRPTDKERKHRSSKKHRSPERSGTETRYHVDNGRAKLYHSSSYSRKLAGQDHDHESFYYDYEQPSSGTTRAADSHPATAARDAYSGSSYRVKQSRAYGAGDVQYSSYPAAQTYREGYPAVYAA